MYQGYCYAKLLLRIWVEESYKKKNQIVPTLQRKSSEECVLKSIIVSSTEISKKKLCWKFEQKFFASTRVEPPTGFFPLPLQLPTST